jgi:hypothetical protein
MKLLLRTHGRNKAVVCTSFLHRCATIVCVCVCVCVLFLSAEEEALLRYLFWSSLKKWQKKVSRIQRGPRRSNQCQTPQEKPATATPQKPALIFIIYATQHSDELGKLGAHSLSLQHAIQESATNLLRDFFLTRVNQHLSARPSRMDGKWSRNNFSVEFNFFLSSSWFRS